MGVSFVKAILALNKRALCAALVICPLVARAQLASTNWPENRGGYGNTGLSTTSGAFGIQRWSTQLIGIPSFAPVTGPDGNLYVGDSNGALYQLNPNTGAINWNYSVPGGKMLGIAISKTGVVYACTPLGLSAISTSGGQPSRIGYYPTAFNITVPPVIGPDGKVYVIAGNELLYAIDPSTIQPVWQALSAVSLFTAMPAVAADNSAVYAAGAGTFYALNPTNGHLLWQTEFSATDTAANAVVIASGIAVVQTKNGAYGLNLASHGVAWSDVGSIPNLTEASLSPDQSTLYTSSSVGAFVYVNGGGIAGGISGIQGAVAVGADGTVYEAGVGTLTGETTGIVAYIPNGGIDWICNLSQSEDQITDASVGPDGAILVADATSKRIFSTWGAGLFAVQLPTSVAGGTIATVKISSAAPLPSNVVFTVSAPAGSGITFPNGNHVTLSANTTTASFTVQTTGALTSATIPITATCGYGQTSSSMIVNPDSVTALTAPSTIVGGSSGQVEVDINGQAPSGGFPVTVTSDNPNVIPNPTHITIPAGQSKVVFSLSTNNVTSATTLTLSASLGNGTSASTNVSVNPLSVSQIGLPAQVASGSTGAGTVTLNTTVGSATTVALISSDPSLTIPGSVTVAAGSNSVTFQYSAGVVTASKSVQVKAVCNQQSRSGVVTLIPTAVTALTFSPTTVLGGVSSQGVVTLNGPAPKSGFTVTLKASVANVVTFPSSLNIPAGSTSGGFVVKTGAVATQTVVTVGASGGGAAPTAKLTVNPPALASMTLSPVSVVGSKGVTGTITLSGIAPKGGLLVQLRSTNSNRLTVPSSVSVPAGKDSVTFTGSTSAVITTTQVSVTATFGSGSQTATVTVLPPTVTSLTFSPSTIAPGKTSTATVKISVGAPSSGWTLNISGAKNGVTIPGSVIVKAGAASATFKITANSNATNGPVTITVGSTSNSKSATLTIKS